MINEEVYFYNFIMKNNNTIKMNEYYKNNTIKT